MYNVNKKNEINFIIQGICFITCAFLFQACIIGSDDRPHVVIDNNLTPQASLKPLSPPIVSDANLIDELREKISQYEEENLKFKSDCSILEQKIEEEKDSFKEKLVRYKKKIKNILEEKERQYKLNVESLEKQNLELKNREIDLLRQKSEIKNQFDVIVAEQKILKHRFISEESINLIKEKEALYEGKIKKLINKISENSNLKELVIELKKEKEKLIRELKNNRAILLEKDISIDNEVEKLCALKNQLQEKSNILKNKEEELVELQKKIGEISNQLDIVKEKLLNKEKTIEEWNNSLKAKYSVIERLKIKINEDFEIEKQLSDKEESMLKETINKLTNDLEKSQADNTSKSIEIEMIVLEMEELKCDKQVIENEKNNLSLENEKLKNQKPQIEKENIELLKKLDIQTTIVDELSKQKDNLIDENKRLKFKVGKLEEEVEEKVIQMGEHAKNELEKLQEEVESCKKEIIAKQIESEKYVLKKIDMEEKEEIEELGGGVDENFENFINPEKEALVVEKEVLASLNKLKILRDNNKINDKAMLFFKNLMNSYQRDISEVIVIKEKNKTQTTDLERNTYNNAELRLKSINSKSSYATSLINSICEKRYLLKNKEFKKKFDELVGLSDNKKVSSLINECKGIVARIAEDDKKKEAIARYKIDNATNNPFIVNFKTSSVEELIKNTRIQLNACGIVDINKIFTMEYNTANKNSKLREALEEAYEVIMSM